MHNNFLNACSTKFEFHILELNVSIINFQHKVILNFKVDPSQLDPDPSVQI